MTYQSNPHAKATTIPTTNFSVSSGNIVFTGVQNVSTAVNTVIGNVGQNTPTTSIRVPPSPEWRVYKTEGANSEEIYESPANGREAYLASLNIEQRTGRFHWNVYLRQNPETKYLFTGIAPDADASSSTITNVLFLDRIEHEKFEGWLDQYEQRFRSREALYSHPFPTPPSRLGNLLPMPWVHDPVKDTVDVAIWFLRQCMEPVYAVGQVFFFQNEEDAIAYKLKFS